MSRNMSPYFSRVIGVDPSAAMVKQATESTQESNVSYRQGGAEDLSFVEDNSVDLVIAGQAAHWFDYDKVWPMLKRKLRTQGTLAFLGYKENIIVGHPRATAVMNRYCYENENGRGMGPCWEQPGRNILRDLYRSIVPPEEDFEDVARVEYEPKSNPAARKETNGEKLMYKTLKLGELEGYVRTFSAYYGWLEAHPGRKPRAEGGRGDIVDEMFEKILEVEPQWKEQGEKWRDVEVESEWGSVLLLARRK
jgi:hypothetical protein